MSDATRPIYLDYASTTPVHPHVVDAMLPYLRQEFGNPSNLHPLGRRAADAVERARAQVARVLGSARDEVVLPECRQHYDRHGTLGADPPRGLDPVELRHLHVE